MKIHKIEDKDVPEVVNLWYEASIRAHDFISSDYWQKGKDAMTEKYLPNSETYLAIERGEIIGFVSMKEDYLAALFIKADMQRNGIGKQLLNYIKNKRETIQLGVYKKNLKGVQFYLSQDFTILSEKMDNESHEFVVSMEWNK